MGQMSEPTCFACPQPATGTVRAPLGGREGEADACDEHRDPGRWSDRTRALFARISRRFGEVTREAMSEIAEDLIDDALS